VDNITNYHTTKHILSLFLQRHKLSKDWFIPTAMKSIQVKGIFGDKYNVIGKKYVINFPFIFKTLITMVAAHYRDFSIISLGSWFGESKQSDSGNPINSILKTY
jgi:hypothetical protein